MIISMMRKARLFQISFSIHKRIWIRIQDSSKCFSCLSVANPRQHNLSGQSSKTSLGGKGKAKYFKTIFFSVRGLYLIKSNQQCIISIWTYHIHSFKYNNILVMVMFSGNENWKKIENALNLANYCFAS